MLQETKKKKPKNKKWIYSTQKSYTATERTESKPATAVKISPKARSFRQMVNFAVEKAISYRRSYILNQFYELVYTRHRVGGKGEEKDGRMYVVCCIDVGGYAGVGVEQS